MNDRFPYLEKLDEYFDIKFLYKNIRGRPTENNLNSLHIAAINGETKTVEDILTQGLPINTQVPFYELTPLHLAALNGYNKTVEALLKKGADTKIVDRNKRTATQLAFLNGHTETAKRIDDYELNKKIETIISLNKNETSNLPTQDGVVLGILSHLYDSTIAMLKFYNNQLPADKEGSKKRKLSGSKDQEGVVTLAPALESNPPPIKRTFPTLLAVLEPAISKEVEEKPSSRLRGLDFTNITSTKSKGGNWDNNPRN